MASANVTTYLHRSQLEKEYDGRQQPDGRLAEQQVGDSSAHYDLLPGSGNPAFTQGWGGRDAPAATSIHITDRGAAGYWT
jgi:hypothetical protein